MVEKDKNKQDPPDKDKDQVQNGEGFQPAEPEPEPFSGDIEGQRSFDGELNLDDVDPKFRDLVVQKGWKTLGEVAEGFKEIERRRSEDGRRKRMAEMSPQGMPPYVPPFQQPSPQPRQQRRQEWKPPKDLAEVVMDPEKSERFINDLRNDIRQGIISEVQYNQAIQDYARTQAYMKAEIDRVQREDPDEFEILRPYMIRISQSNPNIQSLEALRDMAREARKNHIRTDVKQGLSEITGGEIDDSRLKTLFSRTKAASISGASGGGQEGITDPKTRQSREAERIKKEIIAAGTYNSSD